MPIVILTASTHMLPRLAPFFLVAKKLRLVEEKQPDLEPYWEVSRPLAPGITG